MLVAVIGCRDHSSPAPGLQAATQPDSHQQVQMRVETDQEKSCREFVQGFYDWYSAPVKRDQLHRAGVLSFDDVLRLKQHLFDSKLFELLKGDREEQVRNPGYITGLESDPFFNSQDPMPKYLVQSASFRDGHCRVIVQGVPGRGYAPTERDEVEPELAVAGTKWIFVNFHYPGESNPRDNLVDELIWLRNERKKPKE